MTSISEASRNDLRNTPLSAITLDAIGAQRRAAFGRGSMMTGARKPDPVEGRPLRYLERPFSPVRTHGIDLYI